MNKATQKIKAKGYKLTEALPKLGISLRTYRNWEKESNSNHAMLIGLIDELESNDD